MLPTTLSRVAATQRGASAAVLVSSPSTAVTTTALTTQCLGRRRTNHQRRQSSSKAAPPADNNKPAPTAKSTAPAAENASQTGPAAESRVRAKKTSRYNRPLSNTAERSKTKTDYYAGLPAVPGIQHLHEKDFGLCSFFSLHRPLSLTAAIPPPISNEQFNSIFNSKLAHDSWENGNSAERRPEDVIYTLHNTIDALENGTADVQEDGVRWEVIAESQANGSAVKHLDDSPRIKTLTELVDQFRPFNAPPPPESFAQDQQNVEKMKSSRAERSAQAPRQKRYTATIMVTESTDAQGQRTFTASSSPIVQVPDIEDQHRSTSMKEPGTRHIIRQPFLERMRQRGRMHAQARHDRSLGRATPRGMIRRAPGPRRMKMLLISVKRQRKLKMKKHKYKKLMKRTRTLRRRLERS